MQLQNALDAVSKYIEPHRYLEVRQLVDPQWVAEVLEATGKASVRRRCLPAEMVVWLVIGMALFRKLPMRDIVRHLELKLPEKRATLAGSTICEARGKVGAEPLQKLFELTSNKWGHDSARRNAWRGLALYGVDGSTITIADSDENRGEFGGPTGPRGASGYPLVRVSALMALRSHLIADAAFGPYHESEIVLSAQLWNRVPDDSLVIFDRGFLASCIFFIITKERKNRHWLSRAKSTTKWKVVKTLGPGDELVEMTTSHAAREYDPDLPKTFIVRAIKYQRRGFRPQTVLTSLIDADLYSAKEIIELYHERWELELGYDEIKTVMLDREESIRSRTVEGVKQEIWGILLAYNLVRLQMERIANEVGMEPTRISFIGSLRLVCEAWMWCAVASPGAIPKRLQDMHEYFLMLVLPPRRTERCYRREVKIKMSKYPRKRRVNSTSKA